MAWSLVVVAGVVRSDQDLTLNLHSVLPQLKAYYAAALLSHPESTNGGP